MDLRPPRHHPKYCHHEAGHAVAFWAHGIGIEYVTVNSSNPGHSGETKTVDHEVASLAPIETEMKCAAAGEIAARALSKFRNELPDDGLIECFARDAARFTEDPSLPTNDGLRFAELGLARDIEIRKAAPDADTGPATWLPVFRKAERLIEVELWPAVQAVAYELIRNPDDLHNKDVAALAAAALSHAARLVLGCRTGWLTGPDP